MSGANATSRRKPLDPRIPALISNSLQTSHRSFFLLLGDKAKAHAQIVNLHFLLGQSIAGLANPTDGTYQLFVCIEREDGRLIFRILKKNKNRIAQKKNPRPTVLWCYKKDLGFTSNRKKREGKVKREVKRGQREAGDMDPFELFVSVTDVRYT
jgi:N-acetyltransferase 10